LAEKQANSYKEVSAKTNFNVENVFNSIIDELLSQHKKKETISTSNSVGSEQGDSKIDTKPGQTIKLTSIEKKGGKTSKEGCCQI